MSWEREEAEKILEEFDLMDASLANAIEESLLKIHLNTREAVINILERNIAILAMRRDEADSRRQTWISNSINILQNVIEEIQEIDRE